MSNSTDEKWMKLAIDLAQAGQGAVEPNPMVGCVIAIGDRRIGQGWHEYYGGAHAEINALESVAGGRSLGNEDVQSLLRQATAYVSLEPCSHVGKTGPCADALIQAGVGRVVVAVEDPNPEVAGQGILRLQNSGVEVVCGVMEAESREVLQPYLKRTQTGLPWVIAKWAMTLDGSIATSTGDSKWISNEQSREQVHQLRGRVDAVMVGIGTAEADDPMLNARSQEQPEVQRNAIRLVVDPSARISLASKLVSTAKEHPVLIACCEAADEARRDRLRNAGCEVFVARKRETAVHEVLQHLGDQGASNVLVEGGAGLLGSMNDQDLIDECMVFLGPKLFGGLDALRPIGGNGVSKVNLARRFRLLSVEQLGDDVMCVYRKSAK